MRRLSLALAWLLAVTLVACSPSGDGASGSARGDPHVTPPPAIRDAPAPPTPLSPAGPAMPALAPARVIPTDVRGPTTGDVAALPIWGGSLLLTPDGTRPSPPTPNATAYRWWTCSSRSCCRPSSSRPATRRSGSPWTAPAACTWWRGARISAAHARPHCRRGHRPARRVQSGARPRLRRGQRRAARGLRERSAVDARG